MPNAGETAVRGLWPGQRMVTTIATSDSATFTGTESGALMSVTFAEVTGTRYRVRVAAWFNSANSSDQVRVRLRENNATGTVHVDDTVEIRSSGSTRGWPISFEISWTGTATGAKTFVITGQVINTAGPARIHAANNRPSYLYVDYLGTA